MSLQLLNPFKLLWPSQLVWPLQPLQPLQLVLVLEPIEVNTTSTAKIEMYDITAIEIIQTVMTITSNSVIMAITFIVYYSHCCH